MGFLPLGVGTFGGVIAAEQGVGPARRAAQRFILDHRRVDKHLGLAAFVFEAVIGAAPDAFEIVDFALAVARPAARTVALVFRALAFGAEERDVGQGTVAAVLAAEHRGFAPVLEHAQAPRALHRIPRIRVDLAAEVVERFAGREDGVVNELAQPVTQRDVVRRAAAIELRIQTRRIG